MANHATPRFIFVDNPILPFGFVTTASDIVMPASSGVDPKVDPASPLFDPAEYDRVFIATMSVPVSDTYEMVKRPDATMPPAFSKAGADYLLGRAKGDLVLGCRQDLNREISATSLPQDLTVYDRRVAAALECMTDDLYQVVNTRLLEPSSKLIVESWLGDDEIGRQLVSVFAQIIEMGALR